MTPEQIQKAQGAAVAAVNKVAGEVYGAVEDLSVPLDGMTLNAALNKLTLAELNIAAAKTFIESTKL